MAGEMGTTRRKILELLKRGGPQTSAELASKLGVTPVAVRQHLQILGDQELLVSTEQRHQVGRPAQRWDLSGEAQALFPDEHEQLAVDLLEAVDREFGHDALQRVLAARTQRQADRYRRQMPESTAPLERRVKALVQIRNQEGHMAECHPDEEGGFVLVQNNCPICTASSNYPAICSLEPSLLEGSLGDGVRVERIEFARNGSKRCAFRVRSKRSSGSGDATRPN